MSKYNIEQADLERDRDGILNVLVSNFDDFNLGRYNWLYLKNPCGHAHTYVARGSDSDKIVGCVSIFPRRMVVAGKQYLGGITGDFAVNKDIRGFLGFQLQRAITSHAHKEFDFLYSIPNPQSEMIMERIGYLKVENIFRIAKVLKAEEKLKGRVNPVLAKLSAPMINFFLNRSLKSKKSLYGERITSDFDGSFDNLWAKISTKSTIIGVRDSGYLNWKYCLSPYFDYMAFSLYDKNPGELMGYVIYHIYNARCVIDDLQHIGNIDFCIELMRSFLQHLKQSKNVGVVSVFLSNASLMHVLVKTLGFYERGGESKLIIYLSSDHAELNEYIKKASNWDIFKGDWDI